MKHFTIHRLSKTHTSLLPKVSDSLCCGNRDSAVFFYHSDHLGSASWITNSSGTPVQHLQYMPYGEPFVNERTSSYNERFTFTGKERDSETGFSYFGARCYDSDLMTGWLSVDPMADKYPGLSPYAYCAWNPVKLVDPDGREIIIHNMEWAKKIANDLNAIYKATYNIDQDAFAVQQVKDRKGNVYNRLVANKEFNWNLDKYTKAMKECIDDPEKVTIKVVKNENPDGPTLSRGRKVKDFIRDLGGGMIDRKTVYISEKLPTYSKDNGTQGKFAKNHCLGGIVMHELLYHLHNVGETDIYNSKETPTIMQSYYKIKRSNEHPAGVNQVFPSNKKRK